MRVTLTIDDDVHTTAKKIARQEGATLGQVITEMMRVGMQDELRRRPELLSSSAATALIADNNLGKRIQARFKGLGQIPVMPRRLINKPPLKD